MPKLFPINIEVEELAVGKVMRLLNSTPGVAKLHLDLEHKNNKLNGGTPRGPYAPRKQPVSLEETGEEVVGKALYAKSPMTVSELREKFLEQGRSKSSISSVVHTMKNNGDLVSGPDGYSLSKKMRDRMRHKKSNKKKR
jgi:hypothetical protein